MGVAVALLLVVLSPSCMYNAVSATSHIVRRHRVMRNGLSAHALQNYSVQHRAWCIFIVSFCILKRYARNVYIVRCPRTHFTFVKNVHQSVKSPKRGEVMTHNNLKVSYHVSYTSEYLSSCTFASTANSNSSLSASRTEQATVPHWPQSVAAADPHI